MYSTSLLLLSKWSFKKNKVNNSVVFLNLPSNTYVHLGIELISLMDLANAVPGCGVYYAKTGNPNDDVWYSFKSLQLLQDFMKRFWITYGKTIKYFLSTLH